MSGRQRTLILVTAVGACLILILLVCQGVRFDFEREAHRMRHVTIPPNGWATALFEFSRETFSIEVSWVATTLLNWNEYKAWLTTSCLPEFKVADGETGNRLLL